MIAQIVLLSLTSILVIWFYYNFGGRYTFDRVFFILFLLFPLDFYFVISRSYPSVTFFVAALVPLFVLVSTKELIRFRLGIADYLVFFSALLTWVVCSFSSDTKLGFLWFLNTCISCVLPYFLVRILIKREHILRTLFWIAVVITIAAAAAPLEYLFNFRISRIVQYFWPYWVMGFPFRRGGFYRVFGTFGHPIHAAIIFSIGAFIGFLLLRSNYIKNRKISWAMILINCVGVYTTVSRSSYGLVVPILMLINFSFVRRKTSYAVILSCLFSLIYFIGMPMLDSYSKAGTSPSADEAQTSVTYRTNLLPNYILKVQEKPLTGWGFYQPVVRGQDSIDNNYLWIALVYGLPILVLHLLLVGYVLFKGSHAYREADSDRYRHVLWTLISIVVYYLLVGGIVWVQGHCLAFFYIVVGLIVNVYDRSEAPQRAVVFQRVL